MSARKIFPPRPGHAIVDDFQKAPEEAIRKICGAAGEPTMGAFLIHLLSISFRHEKSTRFHGCS